MIRRTVMWLALGGCIGLVASMWWGPGFITYLESSSTNNPVLSACNESIQKATRLLVELQIGVGFGLGLFLAILANVLAYRRAPPKNATK